MTLPFQSFFKTQQYALWPALRLKCGQLVRVAFQDLDTQVFRISVVDSVD